MMKTLKKAEEFYDKAAIQGHALAQYNLAMLFEPDFERMRPHLEQASAQGHASALCYLGSLYMNSTVVEQDYE